MATSRLLINEPPLMVLPSLAVEIGLNEAMILQQIHYWIEINRKSCNPYYLKEGRYWTCGSVDYWAKQFPFWSKPTIARAFKGLEEKGLLLRGSFNKDGFNKTRWTTIDYEVLDALGLEDQPEGSDLIDPIKMIERSDQNDLTMRSNRSSLYIENNLETRSEINNLSLSSYARDQDHDDGDLNQKPQAPNQEPTYHSPVNSEIYDRDRINHDRKDQDQEATPRFRRPPRYPSLAPNPACSTNSTTGHTTNGTPWLPMAPWTSRDEYDRFRAFLEARFPGKNRGYIDAICDRVGKGDFENSAWADFRAGNAPENKAGISHVPQEWLDLVEAEISPVEEAHRGRVHALIMAYNSFRRKYTYSSTGKESKLGTAADDWAKAQVQQLQNS